MSSLAALERKLARLEAMTRAQPTQQDFAIIFYHPDQDQDTSTLTRTRIPPGVITVFYLPYVDEEEDAALDGDEKDE
jgi:hypothetical protein